MRARSSCFLGSVTSSCAMLILTSRGAAMRPDRSVGDAVSLRQAELLVTQRDLLSRGRLLVARDLAAQADVHVLGALEVAAFVERIGVEKHRVYFLRTGLRRCLLRVRLRGRRVVALERVIGDAVLGDRVVALELLELHVDRARALPVAVALGSGTGHDPVSYTQLRAHE